MTLRLRAVLLNYVTNRQLWWIAGWVALMMAPALATRTNLQFFALQMIAFPVGGCVFMLSTQAKWQFCHPRGRLTPGYLTAHLIVAAALAVAAVGALPLSAALFHLNPLGAAACAVALAAPFLWASHSGNQLFNLLALAQFFSLYSDRVARLWFERESASTYMPFHAVVLVAGWTAIAAWFWRLSQLREEMRDYELPLQGQVGVSTRLERMLSARAAAARLLKNPSTRVICDLWHDRLANLHATSIRGRQRLLRYGFSALPPFAMGVWMGLALLAALWLVSQSALTAKVSSHVNAVLPSFIFFLVMPTFASASGLLMRRARMPQELLLPISRREYVGGLLKRLANGAIVSWAVAHLAMLSLVALLDRSALTWSFAAALTALSVGIQVYAFGAQTGAASIQRGGKRNVVMAAALTPALLAAVIGLTALTGPTTSREVSEQ
jgi:hypothetical protein